MKKNFLLLFLTLSIQVVAGAKIKNPQIDYTPTWMAVHEIEQTKDATIIRCDLQNLPNYWVMVANNTILRDKKNGKNYKLLRVEGVEMDKQVFMPESGHIPCTLYFQALDKGTDTFDIIEPGGRAESQVYGVHLKSSAKKPSKDKVDYRSMNEDYYMSLPHKADKSWTFSNERYKDMSFYKPGKAHLIIHLDNLVDELKSNFENTAIIAQDLFLNNYLNQTTSLNDKNCWEMDVNIPGPQFVTIAGLNYINVFVQPGDTLEIFSTVENDLKTNRPKYSYFRGNSESAMINALMPKLMKNINVPDNSTVYDTIIKAIKNGTVSIMPLADKWSNIVNHIIESKEVHDIIDDTPLSEFGKDMMIANAIYYLTQYIEDLRMQYDMRQLNRTDIEHVKIDSAFVPLDSKRFYSRLLKHKSLIYDNPLALCSHERWVFINRTVFSPIMITRTYTTDSSCNISGANIVLNEELRNTFMRNLYLSQTNAGDIKRITNELKQNKDNQDIAINHITDKLSTDFTKMTYPKIVSLLLGEYRNLIRTVEGKKEDSAYRWNAEQQALMDKLVKPYRGNVLFLDFWGLGCGPCLQGMLSLREKVEALKDVPFRFLYIASENEERRKEAEKWMNEKNIKGEHIFITDAEWNRLMEMFSFTGIPHSVLVGKDGEVIQDNFYINSHSIDELKEIAEKK